MRRLLGAGPIGLKGIAVVAFALLLGACSGTSYQAARHISLPDPPAERAEPLTPAQREHRRILAVYGGAYSNPRLEEQLNATVEKLVAASERPDLHYKVTILNSPAVNAFALPTGQLYVTRGLLALANDTSEVASVLSHEMAHVIARHAAIREDQIRQASLVNRVASDVLGDPQTERAGARQIEDRARHLLARPGIRGRRHRRRHFLARRLRSVWRDPLPHRDGPQCRIARRREGRSAHPGIPVVASGDARARRQCHAQCAPIFAAAAPPAASARNICARSTG